MVESVQMQQIFGPQGLPVVQRFPHVVTHRYLLGALLVIRERLRQYAL